MSLPGLYLHVPYCSAICHYCDFAKTANFTPDVARSYLEALQRHTAAWFTADAAGTKPRWESFGTVFFGGGTPSLFKEELEPLFQSLRDRLACGAEVTLEANPEDVTDAALAVWRRLGVTRLSIGVQTLDPDGLAFMHRTHDGAAALAAIARARQAIGNVNADLIYGWPQQDARGWAADIDAVVAAGATHLSLYNLTYEKRTPIGRAADRGRLAPQEDETLASRYEEAVARLAHHGFIHDEVSNWSLPGHTCKHNWLYWQDGAYLGVGAGAHGYMPEDLGPGQRFAYARNDRGFLHADARPQFDTGRNGAVWLTEYIGASLRTSAGVELARVARKSGVTLQASPVLQEGLDRGYLQLRGGHLVLAAAEWFRETAWCVEVLRSLR